MQGIYAKNNLTTIRNILRLVACGDNTKFFKNAILPDINNKSYELLYKAFETLHGCNENDFDENGKRIYKDDKLFATIKKDVQMIVKNMFSIPVSNELTKKVNVKFNSTDLGTLHKCYVKGINVSVNKNYKTGEVTYKTVKKRIKTVMLHLRVKALMNYLLNLLSNIFVNKCFK